jgi:hypothetical protein
MKEFMQIARPAKPVPLSRPQVVAISVLVAFALAATIPAVHGQQSSEKTFATPGEAVLALYSAARDNDQSAMSAIFGNNSGDVLHSGDDVADNNARENFLRRYEQMHRVVVEPDGTVTLYIGAENWPFPVSIVKTSSGAWYFDTESGKQEILYRRIGINENDAIEIFYALVDAQREYASVVRSGESSKHYAMRFFSDEGKQNGLYWKTSGTEPPSPIGPVIADATSQGYTDKSAPFHGYYFRMLTKQGTASKGGAKEYVVNGQLIRGFAFVAYPAEYKNSGIMTFIVDQHGVVYEKDLGPDTQSIASAMTEYNLDNTWDPVD